MKKWECTLHEEGICDGQQHGKPQHTPTPPLTYRTVVVDAPEPGEDGDIYEYEIIENSVVIARTYDEDRAAFIVRAVNAYEQDQEIKRELVKALKHTRDWLNNKATTERDIYKRGGYAHHVLRLDEAIAKVERKPGQSV